MCDVTELPRHIVEKGVVYVGSGCCSAHGLVVTNAGVVYLMDFFEQDQKVCNLWFGPHLLMTRSTFGIVICL